MNSFWVPLRALQAKHLYDRVEGTRDERYEVGRALLCSVDNMEWCLCTPSGTVVAEGAAVGGIS